MKRSFPSSALPVVKVSSEVSSTAAAGCDFAWSEASMGADAVEPHAEVTATRKLNEKTSKYSHLSRKPLKFTLFIILTFFGVYFNSSQQFQNAGG